MRAGIALISALLGLWELSTLVAGLGAGHPEAVGVTLTSARPVGWISIDAAQVAGRPPVVELVVTRVQNPAGVPISLSASLQRTDRPSEEGTAGRIGSVTFFPPDRPGKYRLDTSGAFRSLEAADLRPADRLKLRLEIRPVHAQQDWPGIEVEVAPPRWLALSGLSRPSVP